MSYRVTILTLYAYALILTLVNIMILTLYAYALSVIEYSLAQSYVICAPFNLYSLCTSENIQMYLLSPVHLETSNVQIIQLMNGHLPDVFL